jgi:hypothetical protein
VPLKLHEDFADTASRAELPYRILEALVLQLDQLPQVDRIQLTHITRHVVIEYEAQEFLLAEVMANLGTSYCTGGITARKSAIFRYVDPLRASLSVIKIRAPNYETPTSMDRVPFPSNRGEGT